MDEEVLNAYCWMYSTFDIPPDFKVSTDFVVIDVLNILPDFKVSTDYVLLDVLNILPDFKVGTETYC